MNVNTRFVRRILFGLLLLPGASPTPRPSAAEETAAAQKPIRAVIFTGGCCHDYDRQKLLLSDGIGRRTKVEWTIVHEGGNGHDHKYPLLAKKDWAKDFDVVIYNMCFSKTTDPDYIGNILKAHEAGLPAVVIHCTMHTFRDLKDDDWREFLGVTSRRHGAKFPIHVHTVAPDHPILQGLPKQWRTPQGELYHIEKLWPTATALAIGTREASLADGGHACVWVNQYGKGRVFGTTMGHHNETMQQTLYLDLVTRGMLWALDKLDEQHFRRISPAEDAEAQKDLGPKGKVPTPIDQAAAGKTGGKKIKVPNNLALGKPTSASSTQSGRDHRFAVDGQFGTRWCAANAAAGYWWQVDLGKPEKVTGCRIVWEFDGRRYRYKVEGSPDGEQWTMLVDATKSEARDQVQSHKFDADGIRYVRIISTELDNGAWMSFWEFEVHGTETVEVAAQAVAPKLESAAAGGLLSQVKAPDGFKVTLFAAPPEVNYPACIAAAPTGELFVGIDENGSLGKDPTRNQRIVRYKDTDGDGSADEFKVFADKVGSVRGMFFDDNSMWVLHPPLLRVFHDDDGDGVADRNDVLVEGLGTPALGQRGADHCTNGIQMGIDGWLYIAVGDFGFTKAVGTDGRALQLHGGGIVRVRPDGTQMEIYARGTRNIYDVAIDPYMNIFTRDNTNDGGGWDIRLSHIIPSGNYGYPSLFKNFADEIVQPLAVLGGGSGTGALYISEPGLPAGYGDALYTCDWGRNAVYMHHVTPNGAGFTADQNDFVKLPRPTDIDVDGQGRIYIASWNNGQFAYKGPNVGYVIQLTPVRESSVAAFPDLAKASTDELVQYLSSASHKLRLHAQREILRREFDASDAHLNGVAKLARQSSDLAVRAAAIFTLGQSISANSDSKLPSDEAVQEFTVRALGDRQSKTALADFDFTDKQPRVRLQAAASIGRVGAVQQADALVQATADSDPLVAHAAINALVNLRAADACFRGLDSGSIELARGAARALQHLHEPAVVDGLVARLQRAQAAEVRLAIFRALCRLYHREADWNGSWWSTRPDTTGPYFKFATWDETTKIGEVLKYTLAAAPEDEAKEFLVELNRHRIKLGDSSPQLFRLAAKDPALRATALALLQQQRELPGEARPLVEETAADKAAEPVLRAQSLSILARHADDAQSLAKLLVIFAEIDASGSDAEPLLLARDQFIYELRHAANIEFFSSQLAAEDPQQRELAAMVLLAVAGSPRIVESARDQAASAVEKAWGTPELTPTLLRAAGRTLSRRYADRVAVSLNSNTVAVRDAARFAADLLRLDDAGEVAERRTIKDLEHQAVLDQLSGVAGDVDLGRHLFLRQGCIACHTVSPLDTPRGPQLTDIGRRYNRSELAESILKPSAKIAQGFETQWFETTKGLVVDGFVVRESGQQVEVRTIEGTERVIPTAEIAERGKRDISVMPQGLAGDLTPSELASLLAYLESLRSE